MKKTRMLAVTIAAGLIGLVLSGCQATLVPVDSSPAAQSQSPTPTPTPTPVAPTPLTIDNLLTAPVPAACTHPAGTLVDGRLPGIPEGEGHVSLGALDLGAGLAAFNPAPADGDVAAVAVIICDGGGVTWPEALVAYDSELNILESFDTGQYTHAPNDSLDNLRWNADNSVSFTWHTHHYGEPSCCGTLVSEELLTFSNDGVFISLPDIAEVRQFTEAFWGAVGNRDWAAVDAMSVPPGVSSVISDSDKVHQLMVGDADGDGVVDDGTTPSITCISAADPEMPNGLEYDISARGAEFACTKSWHPPAESGYWMAPTIFLNRDAATGDWIVSSLAVYWT